MQSKKEKSKFELQDAQYEFPYHYIPHFDEQGYGSRSRILHWGFDYLLYMKHAVEQVSAYTPESLLDIGCGDGRLVGMLDGVVPKCVGVDLSERAIAFAKAFHPHIDFRCVDASTLDQSFDVVTAIQVLEHIPDDQTGGFFQAIRDRLQPHGKAIIMVPTVNLPLNPKHYRHYTAELLQAELEQAKANLEVEQIEYLLDLNWLYSVHKRLNRRWWWLYEFSPLRRRIWRYFWSRLRYAEAATGAFLSATLVPSR